VGRLVAVTGATGFIGRTIVRTLLARGYRVQALVRQPARASGHGAGVTIIAGSLADTASLRRLMEGTEAIVHCAGVVRGASWTAFHRVNVEGVANLLRAARALKPPPRLLLMSSLAAREPDLSHYARSKRAGEEVLANEGDAIRWCALRPPAVYGPGDRELLPLFRLMSRGFAPVVGSPMGRFSMLFVEDLAAAVQAWLERAAAVDGEVLPLHDGCPGGYGWDAISATIERLCGQRPKRIPIPPVALTVAAAINLTMARLLRYSPMLTPGKVRELRHPDWVCDNEKIQQLLDWRPTNSLEQGLRQTPGWCTHLRGKGPD